MEAKKGNAGKCFTWHLKLNKMSALVGTILYHLLGSLVPSKGQWPLNLHLELQPLSKTPHKENQLPLTSQQASQARHVCNSS